MNQTASTYSWEMHPSKRR